MSPRQAIEGRGRGFPWRWGPRRLAVLGGVLLGVLLLIGFIQEGIDRRQVVDGRAVQGTFTLEKRTKETYGKPPASYGWRGRFVSDDGTVDRSVEMGETLPGDDPGRRRPSGGWEPGDSVRAVWTDDLADEAFLESGSRAWRNWVESAMFGAVFSTLLVSVIVGVRIRRRRARQRPDGPLVD
jgi:hypothetical protein